MPICDRALQITKMKAQKTKEAVEEHIYNINTVVCLSSVKIVDNEISRNTANDS